MVFLSRSSVLLLSLCFTRSYSLSLELVGAQTSTQFFNYAVESKLYSDVPNKVFVTTRGAAGHWPIPTSSPNASVTVLDLSDPSHPSILETWTAPASVEGQDLYKGVLVVCDIGRGGLYTFDSACISCGPIGYVDLSIDAVLHVRIFERDGTVYALATSGFATQPADALVVVNVTDPRAPSELLVTGVGVSMPEGITIHGNFAYVGGCTDTQLAVVSLASLPVSLPVVQRIEDPGYAQMVATPRPFGDGNLMLAALWAEPGGLAVLSLDGTTGQAREVGRMVGEATAKANRVAVDGSFAFLPLEQETGGIALIDVSSPSAPSLLATAQLPGGTCYCLFAARGYVHAFNAATSSLQSFRVTPSLEPEAITVVV